MPRCDRTLPQDCAPRSHQGTLVNAVAESRSIAYSADTAARAGRIACQVLRSHGADEERVAFAIAVRNDTGYDAHIAAGVTAADDLPQRTIVRSVVGPYSDFSTNVELELARYGGVPELRVGLSGEDIDFALIVPRGRTLAASRRAALTTGPCGPHGVLTGTRILLAESGPAEGRGTLPAVDRRQTGFVSAPQRSPSAIPMLAIFVAIMVGIGALELRPQVSDLSIPPRAQAATGVPIAYRATGIGTVTFRVTAPNADTIATGVRAPGSGRFYIRLPKDSADRAYLVRVGIDGPLGSAFAEDYVRVPAVIASAPVERKSPPPNVPPPQIRSLAVDRAALSSGDTLNVYYDVAATSGSVALVDSAAQITYGKADISASGHTAFVIPALPSQRYFNVIVSAKRGSAMTQSRIAVSAEPQASPAREANAGNSGDAGGPIATNAGIVPVIVTAKSVRSGRMISLLVRDAVDGMTIVLKDNAGNELARREIVTGAAQFRTTFTAPAVRAATQVRLESTYPQGSGSETVVQTIDVH